MVHCHGGTQMDRLRITKDGLICVSDYKSLHGVVLRVLTRGPMTVYTLVSTIRKEYIEFRYLREMNFIYAIRDLGKDGMLVLGESDGTK